LSGPEAAAALAGFAAIPRDADVPVFPAPWAARAFALAVALNEGGLFTWSEWAEMLGAELRRPKQQGATDPEAYWRAWLAALEAILSRKEVAASADLATLQEAWRRTAEATPHGREIVLSAPR
jgi:nitrile hydratase accessory protein